MTYEEMLALTHAVSADNRGRLLNADNTVCGTLTLTEAVSSGAAFFVQPRRDLLVIDADLPDAADLIRVQRQTALDTLIATLQEHQLPYLLVASGRPGNRHIYIPIQRGLSRLLITNWCTDRGLDIRGGGIRPPGAPHRLGIAPAQLLSPAGAEQALGVLHADTDDDSCTDLATALTGMTLPSTIRRTLRAGHESTGFESASHARMALAVAIRARGGRRDLLRQLLYAPWSPLGQSFRDRPEDWRTGEVERLWRKAAQWQEHRAEHDPALATIRRWAAGLGQVAWAGRGGSTDRAVAEAFARRALRAHTPTLGYALSDIAVDAGVSRDTARRSVARLLTAGWLQIAEQQTASTSRVYRLTVAEPATTGQGHPSTGVGASGPDGDVVFADLGSDLARWAALGKQTSRVIRHLERCGPLPVQELSAGLQISGAAMRYHLRKLRAAGLATTHDGRWSVCDALTPLAQDLAVEYGVLGARDRQRLTVARQRQARRAYLARGRARHRAAASTSRGAARVTDPGPGYSARPRAAVSRPGVSDDIRVHRARLGDVAMPPA